MEKYNARLAELSEAPLVVEWTHQNRDKNLYDPEVFQYNSTRIMAVDKGDELQGFLPFQATIMTESLAPKPGVSKRVVAAVLKTAIHQIARWAKSAGMGEIYFLSRPSDVETREYAKAHGYAESDLIVMRLKLNKMDPPLPEEAKE